MSNRIRRARARRGITMGALFLMISVTALSAHDMFLKPTRFFAPENSEVRVRLLNGTFTRSENSIARNRLADASVVTPTRRITLDTTEWNATGDTSTFHIHTRGAGTYVIGTSTRPSVIALEADDFNLYLRDDGIPDVLEARKQANELTKPARERYHKHVKALIQVGNTRSNHYSTAMGYPAEIIPLENPYSLGSSGTLRVKTLVDGKPLGNQYVLYGGVSADEKGFEQKSVRSNGEGIATINIGGPGTYYVKFINMAKVKDSVDYESKWATLTFQIR